MGDWFQPAGQRSSFQGSSAVTAAASVDTYGSWAQIMASIPFDVAMWNVDIFTDPFCFVFDVGTSPDGVTWTPLISLPVGRQQSVYEPNFHAVPLLLPAGRRLGARCMSETASKVGFPDFNFMAGRTLGSMDAFQRATTYGLTGSKGVAIATGATQAAGSWTTITAATTNPTKALILALQNDGATGYANDVLLQFDIGIGNTGNAVDAIVFNKLYAYGKNGITYLQVQPNHGPYPCSIPAGTRLAVRATAPNIAAAFTTRCSVIGFD